MRLPIAILSSCLAIPALASAQMSLPQSTPAPATLELPTRKELIAEMNEKVGRVQALLARKKLGGVLVTRVNNFSWLTAGLADNHIVITSEIGASSLLVLADGSLHLLASNSEVPRMMAEDLKDLGVQAAEYKWYEDKGPNNRRQQLLKQLAKGKRLGTDVPEAGLTMVDDDLAALQVPLTDTELKKYRWLGRATAEAVVETARALKRGMTERQIEAMASDALMRRQIRPTVLLIGTDDRLAQFRHATPSDAALKHYGMINVCARRWGLVVAVTRFVYLGALPAEMKRRLKAAARVQAELQSRTVPGARTADLMQGIKDWYAAAGFPGEWERHHQGGAIGYRERDWVIHPGLQLTVQDRQAFAWNPTVQGTKIEDTLLALKEGVENLTTTPGWPVIEVEVDGKKFAIPSILFYD